MKTFKVFSKERALICISNDCRLLYTEPNRKKPWLSVFVFEDTDKLHEILTMLNENAN